MTADSPIMDDEKRSDVRIGQFTLKGAIKGKVERLAIESKKFYS
jgi:hypothetical protein